MVGQTAYVFVCCIVVKMCLKPYSNAGCQSRRKGLPWPGLARLQASYLRILIVPTLLVCPQPASFLRAVPWQKKNVYEAELGSTSPSIGKEDNWPRRVFVLRELRKPEGDALNGTALGLRQATSFLFQHMLNGVSVILLLAFPRYRTWVVWRHDGSYKFPVGGECGRSNILLQWDLCRAQAGKCLGAFACDLVPSYNWPEEGAESLPASVLPSEEMFNDYSCSCKDTI